MRAYDVLDQVAARNLFNPSLEYLAARDHMMHVVYNFLQPSRLLDMYTRATTLSVCFVTLACLGFERGGNPLPFLPQFYLLSSSFIPFPSPRCRSSQGVWGVL